MFLISSANRLADLGNVGCFLRYHSVERIFVLQNNSHECPTQQRNPKENSYSGGNERGPKCIRNYLTHGNTRLPAKYIREQNTDENCDRNRCRENANRERACM